MNIQIKRREDARRATFPREITQLDCKYYLHRLACRVFPEVGGSPESLPSGQPRKALSTHRGNLVYIALSFFTGSPLVRFLHGIRIRGYRLKHRRGCECRSPARKPASFRGGDTGATTFLSLKRAGREVARSFAGFKSLRRWKGRRAHRAQLSVS